MVAISIVMKIKGKVLQGQGKGQYYVQKCLPELEAALGFTCHPGTLNIDIGKALRLPKTKKIVVTFKDSAPVDCYLVKIKDLFDGAIVVPQKTTHGKEIIELVAPVNLRERLYLKDGDEVECELV